jgi:hypothetical protein
MDVLSICGNCTWLKRGPMFSQTVNEASAVPCNSRSCDCKLTGLVVLILSLPIPYVWVRSRVFKTAAKCLIALGSPNGCEVQDCGDRSLLLETL